MMLHATVKRSYNKPALLLTLLLMSIITATLNSDQNFEPTSLVHLRPCPDHSSPYYSVNFCYVATFHPSIPYPLSVSLPLQFHRCTFFFESICLKRVISCFARKFSPRTPGLINDKGSRVISSRAMSYFRERVNRLSETF